MPTIPLREYLAEIEDLLQNEGYERAITLCQHALRTYPRCVDFYKLLGQACLETDRPDDAADMFRRVLGADPESFVAHVGLGVVADGIGALDEAIWQLERALEVEPNHSEVRQELQRMLARKDGKPQTRRLKLTRAALGRIYLNGEQYERAAAEFRSVLNSVPKAENGTHDRFDVQVALAEALYRSGHQREAAEVCQQVLKVLPNALKANLFLGDIFLETGREEDARPLFDRAQSLDPENRIAQQVLNQPSPLLPRKMVVEMPSGEMFIPAFSTPTTSAPSQPSLRDAESALPWLTQTSAPPTETVSDTQGEDIPDWLKGLRTEATSQPATSVESENVDTTPEWLKALRDGAPAAGAAALMGVDALPQTESETVDEAQASPAEAQLEANEEPVIAATETAPPAWLDALQAERTDTSASAEEVADASDAELTEVPAWLRSLRTEAPESETPAAEAPAAASESDADEMPDWLKHFDAVDTTEPETADSTPAAESPADVAASSDEMPAWLREFDATVPPPSSLLAEDSLSSTEPVSTETELPPWLAALQATDTATEESTAPIFAADEPSIAEPPPAPREAISYFDDSTAPPSIEEQALPVGDAEHQARLELARTMRDLDVDSALDLYALMGDAPAALRQQALDDLDTLADTNPRAQSIRDKLQAAVSEAPSAARAPEVESGMPPWLLDLQRAAPAETETRETRAEEAADQPVPAPAAAPEVPVVAEETLEQPQAAEDAEPEPKAPTMPIVDDSMADVSARAPREASAYFDDASAPPSIETHAAPSGEAEFAARLDLARTLKDLDVDAALDQYASMVGASALLLQAAIDDVSALTHTHAHYPRTQEVLEQLRALAQKPATEAPAIEEMQQMMPAPEETRNETAESAEPIVSEDTVEAARPPQTVEAEPEAAELPIVDETVADEPPPAPREATAYLDDASAPPSVETQTTPIGTAELRARLELARALKFIDVDEALAMYAQLATSSPSIREQAIHDVEELAHKHPQASALLREMRAESAPAAEQAPEVSPAPSAGSEPEAPSVELESEPPTAELAPETLVESEPAPREPSAYFDDASAPPSVEAQAAPGAADEAQARLELARTLREVDLRESMDQYQALVDANSPLLAQVIEDLQALMQTHPQERAPRVLLADALTRAGRLPEAIELYRQLV